MMIESPSFSIVVPITPEGRIAFVRNLHPIPGLGLLELPGGRLEPGESPKTAARRELSEETGWRAGKLTPIGKYYPNPHWGVFQGHFFLGEDLLPGPPSPDPEERIEPDALPIRKTYELLRAGRFLGGSTIVGLYKAEPLLQARGWNTGATTPRSGAVDSDRRGQPA